MGGYYAYVLEDTTGKRYKGCTNNLERRLQEHTRGKTKTTKKMSALRLVHFEEFNSFEEAREREVYFKTAAGRRYLNKKISGCGSIG